MLPLASGALGADVRLACCLATLGRWCASASKTALCGARRQFNRRNAAGGVLLILTELRILLRPPRVDAVVLLTGHRFRDGRVRLVADLDSDLGMGEQVVIPVGVGGPASSGGEDEQSVALAQIHHRVGAALAALGAGGREQQQRSALPHATDLALMRPERLNRLAIPVIPVRHWFPPLQWLLTLSGQHPSFVHNGERIA